MPWYVWSLLIAALLIALPFILRGVFALGCLMLAAVASLVYVVLVAFEKVAEAFRRGR